MVTKSGFEQKSSGTFEGVKASPVACNLVTIFPDLLYNSLPMSPATSIRTIYHNGIRVYKFCTAFVMTVTMSMSCESR